MLDSCGKQADLPLEDALHLKRQDDLSAESEQTESVLFALKSKKKQKKGRTQKVRQNQGEYLKSCY